MGNIYLEIDDNNDNYININYVDKGNEDMEKNKNNILTNLGKITTNESAISTISGEITTISNDISKLKSNEIYLKNVYNSIFRGYNYILSYSENTPFYKKNLIYP